jgi:hypothetical protein
MLPLYFFIGQRAKANLSITIEIGKGPTLRPVQVSVDFCSEEQSASSLLVSGVSKRNNDTVAF